MPTQTVCSNCGGDVSPRGRRSPNSTRFCNKRECQAAKARLRRQRLRTDRQAPTECSGCGATLPQRGWRSGDEHGRWCNKEACRIKRRGRADQVEESIAAIERIAILETDLELAHDAVMADNEHIMMSSRLICHRCGLTSALKGWVHVTSDGRGCQGTLDGLPVRRFSAVGHAGAWPFEREWLAADELAVLRGEKDPEPEIAPKGRRGQSGKAKSRHEEMMERRRALSAQIMADRAANG